MIGNEDCGQMSAWYVLSSMGIYAVTPGNAEWTTTIPYFDKIKVNLENGKNISITKEGMKGDFAALLLKAEKEDFARIVPVPIFESEGKSFTDKMKVSISAQNPSDEIYWMFGGPKPGKPAWTKYSAPIEIGASAQIIAYVLSNGQASYSIKASFFKKPNYYIVAIKSKYDPQYHAGGPEGLVDGIFGNENWRKGDWQGFQGQDFEATIDLQKVQLITSVSANFLQDSRSWILMPTKVSYFVSDDNINFKLLKSIDNQVDASESETIIKKIDANIDANGRYVKIVANNFGKLPEWHQGVGGDAYIFIDEVTVK